MISSREWRIVFLIIAFTLILTTIPYGIAAAQPDSDWRFSGFVFGVEDGNSYIGKMRLGMRNTFDFHLFYTPEIHDSAPLINLPYLLVGWFAGWFVSEGDPASHDTLILAFHIFRWAADALLILAMYRFIARFLDQPRSRRLALLVALFGGGFGWLLALIGQTDLFGSLPADLYIPEGFSFQMLFGLPHLALARAALLLGFTFLINLTPLSTWRGGRGVRFVLAGLCWLIVGLIVPFYLAVIYVVLGVWGLAAWLRTRRFPLRLALMGGIAALIALPALIYNALVFANNPAFGVWSAQNILISPHPLHYAIAYGLFILAAAFGVRSVWSRARGDSRWMLPLAWVAIVPILVYLPINVQRRLSEAVIVPLAILAVVGLQHLTPRAPLHMKRGSAKTGDSSRAKQATSKTGDLPLSTWRGGRGVRLAFLALISLSAVFLWLGGLITALNPRPPAFIPANYAAAFTWINQHWGANAQPDEVVLASVPMGNALPAYTRARIYMGHGPETLFWQAKTDVVERLYRGDLSAPELYALFNPSCPPLEAEPTGVGLCLLPVRYIVYGDAERALEIASETTTPTPEDGTPAWAEGLMLMYDEAGVRIYRAGDVAAD